MIDISEGILLFNNGQFFEAHDYFEALWIDNSGEERLFLQGIIQTAVGCFHLVSGNYKGSISQFRKANTKLEKYPAVYMGVNLNELLIKVRELIAELEDYYEGNLEKVDLDKIPELEYDPEKYNDQDLQKEV